MQIEQTPLRSNKEHVLYEVESLFTNISMDEKIFYIINHIYWKNKLPQIYSKILQSVENKIITARKITLINYMMR